MQCMLKIAIIGAGPSGLCSARHLTAMPGGVNVKIYEQGTQVGGTWIYTAERDESNGVHSSMYKNLRTNLAKEVMGFPDFQFPRNLPSFPGHSDVCEYIQQYAEHFDLIQHISFRTKVEQVKPIPSPKETECALENGHEKRHHKEFYLDSMHWEVTSRNLDSGKLVSENYQAVFICNGHLTCPDIPTIPGLDLLPKDKVIHTHSYREPEDYVDQKVLIIGAGMSGRDIALDLSKSCTEVYISNKGNSFTSKFPSNVHEMPSIIKLREDATVDFSNSQSIQVDSVLIATGYQYSFPFLAKDIVQVECGGKRVVPLYKHTFNAKHPSLIFIGANRTIIFNLLDYQVRWVVTILAGKKTLPTTEEMIRDAEEKFQTDLEKGASPQRAGHYFGTDMFDLMDDWATLGDLPLLAPVYKKVYVDSGSRRTTDFMNYQDTNYHILDDENWVVVDSSNEIG